MEIIRPVHQGPLLSYPLCDRLQASEVQDGKPPARPMQGDNTGRASPPAPLTGDHLYGQATKKPRLYPC